MIGIRISSHPLAQTLVASFGKPIATTSANLHGKPNPYSIDDIRRQWTSEVLLPDLCIDSGILHSAPPSTVIKVTGDRITVLRQGTLTV